MLKNCFLIAQMNRQINSFQNNMYDILWAKIDHLAGEIYFVQKKNTKNNGQLFGYADFGGCWMPTK